MAQDGMGPEVYRTENGGFGSDQAQDGSVSNDNGKEEEGCARPHGGSVRGGGEKLVGAWRRGDGSGTDGRKLPQLGMRVAKDQNWEGPPELC